MNTGVVKFFNTEKGFGFITPDNGTADIFVHVSQLGGETISEGDHVEYDLGQGKKGDIAINVKVI